MWILPFNHQQSSAFALAYVDSKEELNELWEASSELPFMWRSKPLSLPTFWRQWKRAYWMRPLSGRILKLSMHSLFVEKYTASLEDIHVNPSVTLASGREHQIRDTFTRLLVVALKNRGLYGASSKMSRATYHSVSTLYKRTFEKWVTRLRLESTQRKKSELHIEGTGSLFSHWKTPSASECEGGSLKNKPAAGTDPKYKLRDQVNWGTPRSSMLGHQPGKMEKSNLEDQVGKWSTPTTSRSTRASEGYYPNLVEQAKQWGTPTTRDYKDGAAESVENVPVNGLLGRMVHSTQQGTWPTPMSNDARRSGTTANRLKRETLELPEMTHLTDGHQDQVGPSMNGKSRASLNPGWVAQLMGTTSEKIFFVHLATVWLSKPLNLPLSISLKNTESN